MEQREAKISIIIPIYNVAPYLKHTLDSAINQSLKEIEIICVDDGSTDGSDDIIRSYAAQDRRVKTLFHKTRCCTSQSRKDGVAISSGKYIMFLDGDDELVLDACEKAYDAIENYGSDIVQFGVKVINDTSNPWTDIPALELWHSPCLEEIRGDLIAACFVRKKFAFILWNKIYKGDLCRQAFLQIEDGPFLSGEDLYAFFLIADQASFSAGIGERLYLYHYGRGVYGENKLSLNQYDAILTQAGVYRALLDFCVSRHDYSRQLVVQRIIKPHFLGECVEKWLTMLSPADVADGYSHLIDAWGYEEILCALAVNQCGEHIIKMAEKVPDSAFAEHLRNLSNEIQVISLGRLSDESIMNQISVIPKKPKISIIIPVYNVEQYLRECLDSVVGQSLTDMEIICVNDGSTDSSRKILTEYEKKDPRIIILDKENGGPSSARNYGLAEAKGEYIQFLDSDDLLKENVLLPLYQYASYYKTDLLFYEAEVFFETKELEKETTENSDYYHRSGAYPYTETGRDMFFRLIKNDDFIATVYLQLISREFIEKNKLSFCEDMVHEDNLFTLESLSLAESTRVLVDARYYMRRVRAGSIMTDSNHLRRAYGRFKILYEMKSFIRDHGLFRDEMFYEELIYWLSIECNSALDELSCVSRENIWDFAMQMDLNEQYAFLLTIYQKLELRASYDDLKNSKSYRLGRMLTKPARTVKQMLKQMLKR